MSVEPGRYETFAETVGEEYRVVATPPVTLTLVAATPFAPGPAGPSGAPARGFSLEFRGPTEPVLRQAIVPLQHERLGPIELFLVPIAGGPEGVRYEAIFT